MDKKKRIIAISTLSGLLALALYASYEREYELSYHVNYENNLPYGKYPEECIPYGSYSNGDIYIGDEEYIEFAKGYANNNDILIIMGEQNGDPNATIVSSYNIKSKDETKQLSLYSQSINIEIRLQIIFFIYDILHKKNKEEFKTTLTSLWKIFVLNENSKDLDKNIISRFIFNHFNYFEESQNLMEYVFNNIIINEEMNPPEIINYNIFVLFTKFFDRVNSLFSNIER